MHTDLLEPKLTIDKKQNLKCLEKDSVGSFSQTFEIKKESREDYRRMGGKQGRNWIRIVSKVMCSLEDDFVYSKGVLM